MNTAPVKIGKKRTWILAVLGIVLVIVFLVGIKAMQIGSMIKAGKAFVLPPESVATAKVEQLQWQASRPAVATLVATRSVTLGAELPGTVRELSFESGATVHRGDVLVRLDISTEEAQLAAAQADAALARSVAKRAKQLREQNSNSTADLEAAEARQQQATAQVTALQATIAKKTIRAPFDGRLGIRQVELGQVVSPGTPIASLQSVSPMYAEFYLPQQVLSDLHTGLPAQLQTDVFPKDTWKGVISTVNPEIDVATRNVRVRATFPNPDGRLKPGMFANVEVLSGDERATLVIPATAVMYAPYGDSVFAVEEKDKVLTAKQKFVRLGERRGDLVAVTSGLVAGETLVSSGAFKLHNGSTVVVHNEQAPDAQQAPKLTDDK